ncbi:MAG: response regulator, partial [Flavisolibacter sp.]
MYKILIIEDNAEIRENTCELLQLRNYEVLTAENGKVGFELAKKFNPHVILCDMMMPDSNGNEFLRLAQSDGALKETPVVFFSAGSPTPFDHQALVKLADGFLMKPFTEEELLNIIQEAISEIPKQ